jgi:hypothetical protein
MYLPACNQAEGYDKARASLNGVFPEQAEFEPKEITYEIGYWRKANAIHKWFVDNVQEGKDDCGEYHVSKEQLKDLLGVVNAVLEKRDEAKAVELLPTQGGFFFGSMDYDNYYFNDLEHTKEVLEKALAIKVPEWIWEHFEYHSSW